MSVYETRPEKRTARKQATVDPRYLGTDERGAVHYWDHYARTTIVVDDGAIATSTLADCDRPLKQWREHVEAVCGWADCTITEDTLLAGGF